MNSMAKQDAFSLGEFDSLWDEVSKPIWKPDILKKGEMTAPMYAEWVLKKTGKKLSNNRASDILRTMVNEGRATRRQVRLFSRRVTHWAYLPSKK